MEVYTHANCQHLFYKHLCQNASDIPRYLQQLQDFTKAAKEALGPKRLEINGFPPLTGIYIDGTAACLKSTILSHGDLHVTKYNQICEISEINSSNSGMLQYIIGSYMCIAEHPNRVWDRSFINNLDWSIIWQALEEYNKYQDDHEAMRAAAKVIHMLSDSKMYQALQDMMPGVYIIDRNVQEVYARMRSRNEGSDASRAEIRGYVEVQNLAYIIFSSHANNVLVDLTNFGDNVSRSNVSIGIYHHFFAPTQPTSLQLPKLLSLHKSNAVSQVKTHLERAIRRELYAMDPKLEGGKISGTLRKISKVSTQAIVRKSLSGAMIKVHKSVLRSKSNSKKKSAYYTVTINSKLLG